MESGLCAAPDGPYDLITVNLAKCDKNNKNQNITCDEDHIQLAGIDLCWTETGEATLLTLNYNWRSKCDAACVVAALGKSKIWREKKIGLIFFPLVFLLLARPIWRPVQSMLDLHSLFPLKTAATQAKC